LFLLLLLLLYDFVHSRLVHRGRIHQRVLL